jgi:uncharacterized protein (DUF2141 family)
MSALTQVSRETVRGAGASGSQDRHDVAWRQGSEAPAAATPIFGSIATVASGNPAPPQQIFGSKGDVFLAGGPVTTPCQFPEYLPDGTYYFQVTDASGNQLLSTDPVSERKVTVTKGVIASYNGTTHATDGKTACGSLAVSLMPFADAGSQKAAYVVWLTAAGNFDGNTTAVDNVCGAGCFHGFHPELSRAFAFRVEDKKSCEPTFCVSGTKFFDANGNGVRDSGEAGIPGVEIHVVNTSGVLLQDITGPDGSFHICGLTDSDAFKVTENVPLGFTQTGPVDHDVSRHVFASSGGFVIEVCQEDLTGLDFANQAIPNAIGGMKFEDLNANGARDPGEPGLAGVTIVLTPASGGTPQTTVTDASGNFLFTSVTPGNYVLTEVVPSGFTETMPASDGIHVTLASGGSSLNNLFGNFRGILTGTISGLKFNDINGNGVQDSGETGIPGVTITLSGNGLTRTVVTSSDGSFSFNSVPFGTYTLTETVPAGFKQTAPAAPGTISATLDFGHQTVTGLLFGNQALPATISGTKFNDLNGNGVRDTGEPGLAGVTIQLRNSVGLTTSTTTDASGNFSFTGLAAGPYAISEIVPAGFVQTAPAAPGTFSVTVSPGQNATGFLFGNRAATGSVSGTKFNDLNGNGVRDSGEPGLSGVTIHLTSSSGATLTQITDASGNFTFLGLAAGSYVLSEAVPTGFLQTAPASPGTFTVTLAAGQNATGFLFGNQQQAPGAGSISGTKFNDLNGNGALDTGEPGLSGVTIQLKPSSGPTLTATTDASGNFSFTGLAAGTYVLSEVAPAGFVQTAPPSPGTFSVTLAAGQNATGFLFGNQQQAAGTGSISGTKFLDLDANGIVNGLDHGFGGIVIVLTDSSGHTRQTTSAANGTFSFANLPAGTYVLSEVIPPGFAQTFPGTPDKPATFTITLAPGQNATGFNFLNKC